MINKRASVINLSVTTLIILRLCPFIVAWFLPFRRVRNVSFAKEKSFSKWRAGSFISLIAFFARKIPSCKWYRKQGAFYFKFILVSNVNSSDACFLSRPCFRQRSLTYSCDYHDYEKAITPLYSRKQILPFSHVDLHKTVKPRKLLNEI